MNDKPKTTNEATTFRHTQIDFLYNKIDVPTYPLAYWISVPDFFDEIKRITGTNTTIDNALVFNVMLEIYKEKESDRDAGMKVDFSFHTARKALRSLSLSLFGDKEAWVNK